MGMPGDPSRTRKDAVISSEEEPWRSSRHSVGTPDGTSRGQRHEEGVDRRQSSQQPARLRGERERSTLRRRQATLGGRSGGPEMAGIERNSSMTSQAPAVEASTGRRLERRAARSSSMGRVGASLGASGATGERPQEGPLQGRRRGASVGVAAPAFPASTGFIASTAFPASTSAACEGMSWPTSQSPQLASADCEEPKATSASTATIPQERRSRDSKCWDAGRMAVCTLPGSGWVEATRPETPSRQSSPSGIVVRPSPKSQSTGRSLSNIFSGSPRGDVAGGGRRAIWYDLSNAMPGARAGTLAGWGRGKRGADDRHSPGLRKPPSEAGDHRPRGQ